MALLELKDVRKIYQQGKIEVPALRGINLIVKKGEFTTVFGPSGSGKTTLLNMIGCLDKPTDGSINFNGKELSDLSKKDLAVLRRHNVGFVFQSYNLIPVLTAYENVEFAIRLANKHGKKALREKVMNILVEVGLDGLENRKPNELSGGQKQRVAIARALINSPSLILADEPTGNVDTETGENIMDIFHELNEQGHTILLVTHEEDIAEHAERIIYLVDGKVEWDEVLS